MNKIERKYLLPNAITATNMLLGFLSITMSFGNKFQLAAWLILIAMIFDGLDGLTARKLDAFSEFGKEFDSFCDAVSFGIAPAILIFSILTHQSNHFPKELITPIAFIYALCAVVRLVKFNVVTVASNEKEDFSGMPTPNAANLVAAYVIFTHAINLGMDARILAVIALVSGVLMVSTIPFQIPQKIFSFIPKKFVLPVVILVIIASPYTLLPFGIYYIFANLLIFFNSK